MRVLVATVVTLALALAVVPALAADDKTLQARDLFFEPDDVTIEVGDTVTFTIDPNSGNFHNFNFDNGPAYPQFPSPPGSDWDSQSRTFTAAGTYTYVCDAHGSMTGVINVVAPGSTPTATPSSSPTPTPTSDPDSDPPPPVVRKLRMAAGSFCTKRGKGCAKPGVKVQIDISQPAAVTGILRRRGRQYGRVRFGTVAAGARTLKFTKNTAGRRLTAGRYKLKLTIAGLAPRTLSFKVR